MADDSATPAHAKAAEAANAAEAASASTESVGTISELYLGNILYALERCALSLDEEEKPLDSAFYRGIGRKLAEAFGRAKRDAESRNAQSRTAGDA